MIPNPIIHSTTFGGNPLACAAGLAAIQVTLEEDLPGQAAAKGEFLLRELAALQRKYPQVLAEAHGKGLLIGMEFPVQEIGWQVAAGLFKRGVLVAGTYSKAQVIRIEPALGIPMELLQEMLNRLEDTFKEVARTLELTRDASHPERSEGGMPLERMPPSGIRSGRLAPVTRCSGESLLLRLRRRLFRLCGVLLRSRRRPSTS